MPKRQLKLCEEGKERLEGGLAQAKTGNIQEGPEPRISRLIFLDSDLKAAT